MSGGVPAGELLPCPFCGGVDGNLVQGFTRASDDFAFWSVECLSCGAEIADDESQEAADRHWNARATPTPPIEGRDADVERVRSALVDLVSWFPESGPTVYGPWIIKAGEYGADDAIAEARAALQALGERP